MTKKAVGIFILTLVFLSLPYCVFANTFTLTEAQIERAKVTEGFDLYVFENYMIPEINEDFDFDRFLDLFDRFDLTLEAPTQEELLSEDIPRFNTLDELEEMLIDFDSITFTLVEEDMNYTEIDGLNTSRREASRTWNVDGNFVGTRPRVTLFVEYTVFSSGSFFSIDRINHHGWSLAGSSTGTSISSSTSGANLRSTNHGTIEASGSVTVEQRVAGTGGMVTNHTRSRGGFDFDLIRGYTNVYFNRV